MYNLKGRKITDRPQELQYFPGIISTVIDEGNEWAENLGWGQRSTLRVAYVKAPVRVRLHICIRVGSIRGNFPETPAHSGKTCRVVYEWSEDQCYPLVKDEQNSPSFFLYLSTPSLSIAICLVGKALGFTPAIPLGFTIRLLLMIKGCSIKIFSKL